MKNRHKKTPKPTKDFEVSESGALKDLSDKPMIDLVPAECIEALADVLTYGAKKYEKNNWRKGIEYSKIYSATQRHLLKWLKGIDIDDESGLHHIEHVLCNVAFIVYHTRKNRTDLDDRYKD